MSIPAVPIGHCHAPGQRRRGSLYGPARTRYSRHMVDPEEMASRLPAWRRIAAVGLLVVLASSAALFGYRYFTRPTTLTLAAGSYDGEAVRIVQAIAGRLAK